MADQDQYKTYVRETRTTESSGTGLALIIGGLVVAVGFVLWLVLSGPGPVATTEPTSDTTNVTIEPPAAPANTSTDVTIEAAPAAPAESAEPAAPAENVDPAAPADGTVTPAPAPANE